MKNNSIVFILGVAALLFFAACRPPSSDSNNFDFESAESQFVDSVEFSEEACNAEVQEASAPLPEDLKIITLLPKDGIPAIDTPRFLSAEEADQEYSQDEPVLGVVFNGQARAYSIPLLSRHEIVNDTVGGCKIAVTW